MIINDRIYGSIEITEPVLIELINSKPLQRLKGINQAGASKYVLPEKILTRYEHSVGVMVLLRKLGASLEEQIAGLMHDIPHTAFSHVIDFVFQDENHEFHEKFHASIIKNSEIPAILKKHGFSLKRLLDEHNFKLLERKIPGLCADRIDYTLRDMTAYFGFKKKINTYVASFVVKNNEIVLKKKSIARKFGNDYLWMDRHVWSHPMEITSYRLLADALRIALDKKVITKKDLFEDDDFVYDKLKQPGNPDIKAKLEMLNPKLKIRQDKKNYDFWDKNKVRFINPKFLDSDGTIKQLGDAYPGFASKIEKHKQLGINGNFIKIVSW